MCVGHQGGGALGLDSGEGDSAKRRWSWPRGSAKKEQAAREGGLWWVLDAATTARGHGVCVDLGRPCGLLRRGLVAQGESMGLRSRVGEVWGALHGLLTPWRGEVGHSHQKKNEE